MARPYFELGYNKATVLAVNPTKIKVLTLNIQKGWSLGRRRMTLDLLKKCLRDSGANIICLQEIVGANLDKNRQSQLEFLAEGIWPHYIYGQNVISSQGNHGNAILSLNPIIHFKNVDISNYRLEKRGILHVVIRVSDRPTVDIHVMTLHLDLTGWGRAQQLKKLSHLIKEEVPAHSPLIICGDFNDWREELSEPLFYGLGLQEAHLDQLGHHAKTFPTYIPILKLDRIYFRNLKVTEVKRLDAKTWHQLSDHLGMFAVFEL